MVCYLQCSFLPFVSFGFLFDVLCTFVINVFYPYEMTSLFHSLLVTWVLGQLNDIIPTEGRRSLITWMGDGTTEAPQGPMGMTMKR
jgi:hypothetical protein